ncbi:two-component system response regulator YesN [Paenibacillus shirakamiensis]|uniref:Two-component system response regulator YesN n=1 Tax=Paenibacillus shirakamiensis TaxID=1265935 RepID=A0ABS4JKJ8_9BACL|nr:response regulator [Paenibacillus shirakamiensis]MBP2002239.1 two-component system response regulator YesN [Paenibacillus shirakamiensis]
MKALIVDDERHVREAINLLADWHRHGITEVIQAADGEEAVELIQHASPQIVMTDMRMPRKDGAALLTWLKNHMPDIKVLVISGYDDFDLVRHAIRNGGMDYILKPVDPIALNEALTKAVDAWRAEEQSRQQMNQLNIQMNQMKPLYDDRLLTELVSGQHFNRSFLNELQERSLIPHTATFFSVAVLSDAQFDEGLLLKFHNRRHLLSFALINICGELLRNKGIAIRNINKLGEIVILYWDTSAPLSTVLTQINAGIRKTLQRNVHFGLCQQQNVLSEIPKAYAEAVDKLWKRNVIGNLRYLHEEHDQEHGRQASIRNTQQEERFRLAALSGSLEQMESEAAQWIAHVTEFGYLSPDHLVRWNTEWDWMQHHWSEPESLDSKQAEEQYELESSVTPLPLDETGQLDTERWTHQIVARLSAASRTLTQRHSKDNHTVRDIARFLEQHYNKDISLQDISSQFFLSREYISRKFKQEFGLTILDYLSDIRIRKAKLLLMNPHLRIMQVAEMVGYHDEKYFSKVFKKLEGRTPNEYRKDFI